MEWELFFSLLGVSIFTLFYMYVGTLYVFAVHISIDEAEKPTGDTPSIFLYLFQWPLCCYLYVLVLFVVYALFNRFYWNITMDLNFLMYNIIFKQKPDLYLYISLSLSIFCGP